MGIENKSYEHVVGEVFTLSEDEMRQLRERPRVAEQTFKDLERWRRDSMYSKMRLD